MDALFGIPMDLIMAVLLGALGVCLASIGYVVVRNRIVFLMGLRNMPRRLAQTVLIIIGLMLSTLIISAAFATGDTVDYSISKQAYTLLGHIDEVIQPVGGDSVVVPETGLDVPGDQYRGFQQALRRATIEDVDGSAGVLFELVPVANPRARLSEPAITLTGVDTAALEGFPDVISSGSGGVVDIASLASDEVYMNESAAGDLDAVPGDVVQVFVDGRAHDFTIVDVVEDRVLTGARQEQEQSGMVTRLDTLHGLFKHDRVSFIAVSVRGGVRDTLDLSEQVEPELEALIKSEGLKLEIGDGKREGVELAEEIGNFMATFFLLMGLFSIGAGVLLIIMIFVMLATERRPEMGMARAIGTKRAHLVQMFMSEGTAYNVLSALVGAALGILVAIGMAYLMTSLFASELFGLTIEPHVTPRTLAISYSLGVVLTFLTVTFASWRISNLNIVSAIRGTEEPHRSSERAATNWRWVLLSLPAMLVPPLGLWLLCRKGLGLPWSGRWLALAIPTMIIPPLGLWFLLRNGLGLPSSWIVSGGGLIFGALFLMLGLSSDAAFPFALGFSLMAAGAARLLTVLRLPDRPVYTAAGLLLLVLWGLTAGNRLEFLFGTLEGDFEMFFLSGVAMVAASTYVLIYNADLLLAALSRLGGAFGSILPAMRTAIAYPLANRFRTGMTLAMISLVVFALTMMSTMNLNFNKLFLADDARGGWDVIVEENPNNPVLNLQSRLRAAGSDVSERFRVQGRVSLPGGQASTEVRQDRSGPFEEFPIFGADQGFLTGGQIPLASRARGLDSDRAVWQALSTRDDVAVIDSFAIEAEGFGGGEYDFQVSGIRGGQEVFDPIVLEVRDPASGRSKQMTLIGVIDLGASAIFFGMYLPDSTFRQVFGDPELSWHYIALRDPDQSEVVAKEIEASLFSAGVQAESLKAAAEEQGALFRNFFYLMQAFVGLGLFVGIAAIGVIAFRTVVERRQQIGMLRAIGYKRSTVALSFLMESSFITLLAIASGIGLAIWLSYFLITSDDFETQGKGYYIPWTRIILVAVFTYLASLVMTFIPARQAASIPTAEALRYE